MTERELTMSLTTAIQVEVAIEGCERLEELELEGEEPERQHKVGACTNVPNIDELLWISLTRAHMR